MKIAHTLLSIGSIAAAPLVGACDDDQDGGSTSSTKMALTIDNQSSVSRDDISVGFVFYTEADGWSVPAPVIGVAASETLTIDTAAMLAKLEASPLGTRGVGIGMLIAFHDPNHDGVMASLDDYIGVSQDVAAYYLGKSWDCSGDENVFADDEDNVGFECEPSVQIGRITRQPECAIDPDFGECGCSTHDGVEEIEPLPATLSATIHVYEGGIPCGKSPNLD